MNEAIERWEVYTTRGGDASELLTGSREECLWDYADFHRRDDETVRNYIDRVQCDAIKVQEIAPLPHIENQRGEKPQTKGVEKMATPKEMDEMKNITAKEFFADVEEPMLKNIQTGSVAAPSEWLDNLGEEGYNAAELIEVKKDENGKRL